MTSVFDPQQVPEQFYGEFRKMHYDPSVYQQADEALRPTEYKYSSQRRLESSASIAATNMIMDVLRETLVDPLEQISDLHQRLTEGNLDSVTITKVQGILDRVLSFVSPQDKIHPTLEIERNDVWKRTSNLIYAFYRPLLNDLTKFLQHTRSLSAKDAAALLGSRPIGSVADGVACETLRRVSEVNQRWIKITYQKLFQKGYSRSDAQKLVDKTLASLKVVPNPSQQTKSK